MRGRCGAVDAHRILPLGTPHEVRNEVQRVTLLLGRGGGYLLSSVHAIRKDVPPEIILAMCDAARERGRCPLGRQMVAEQTVQSARSCQASTMVRELVTVAK